MNTDLVLQKYLRHLRHIDPSDLIHVDAAELALRLALEELAEFTPSTTSTKLAILQADLERLQTAANAEVAELKAQLAQLDADNAAMIRHNKELADALHIAQNGTGLVIKNPPFVPLPHSRPTPHQQSPINNSMWDDPAVLTTLDDIAKDWWIGCAAGRHAWRTVPKPVQLCMVRHILSFGPESGSMPMAEFDAIKPAWMPTSGSHTKTLGLSWPQLNDWSIEL